VSALNQSLVVAEASQETCGGFSATTILNLLETALHSRKSEWLFLRELRIGTRLRAHSAQRLDAFALNCLPYQGMKRVCYELKTSRGDLMTELRHPLKRRIGMRYSNEFYFVVPAGLMALDELPVDCGLIEVGRATTDESQHLVRSHAGFFYIEAATAMYCQVTVPAPWREIRGRHGSLLRPCYETKHDG
jgi:hypothetical protein